MITNRATECHPKGNPPATGCDPLTSNQLLDAAFAFWRSTLLLTAHDLGVFAAVADGPLDAKTLIARLNLVPDDAPDFLAALVSAGFLEEHAGRYRNTLEGQRFLIPGRPEYIGRSLAMASAALGTVTDLSSRLRATPATKWRGGDLAARMWEDIAEVLRSAGADERL